MRDVGPLRYQKLLQIFGSAVQTVVQPVDEWRSLGIFDAKTIDDIKRQWSDAARVAEKDWDAIQKNNIRVYLIQSENYPPLLKQISTPPPVLYVKGEEIAVDRPAVAIVGSRRCTFYGEKMARQLSADLARDGVTVVSGLARGIDTCVHKSALEAGGKTWAVIGSGLNHVYPAENKELASFIEKSGAVISEFSMHIRPHPGNFPRRNRVIAGLARGTLVIEGGEKSGSLITARLAAEEGRDVFAVPGPATSPLSAAPHLLIKMGAAMVQTADDVFDALGLTKENSGADGNPKSKITQNTDEVWQELLSLLSEDPTPKEILANRLNKEANHVSSLLMEMELRGLIQTLPGGGIVKT